MATARKLVSEPLQRINLRLETEPPILLKDLLLQERIKATDGLMKKITVSLEGLIRSSKNKPEKTSRESFLVETAHQTFVEESALIGTINCIERSRTAILKKGSTE